MVECNFPWINQPLGAPQIAGGNQQGFVEILDNLTTNDASLFIENIIGNTTTPTVITSPEDNMITGFVIGISGILGTAFSNLNGVIFGIVVVDANNFQLWKYYPVDYDFSIAQLDAPATYYW